MPVVVDNPQWWVLELLDGFGAHTASHKASLIRYENKVLSLKEDADSSSINQAYDKEVAKSDKRIQRQSLAHLQNLKQFNANIVDQWSIMLTGLAAVRHCNKNPNIWINSFIATNTHPTKQIPFADWCKKIEWAIQSSDSYDLITQDSTDIDTYSLLPLFWQAMSPEHKALAVQIVQDADAPWSPECIQELSSKLSVKLSEMPALQPCIFLAIEHPSHIGRGLAEEEETDGGNSDGDGTSDGSDVVAEVEANRVKANSGLSMFQLKPDGLEGTELLDHMVAFRARAYATKQDEHKISGHLAVSPRTHHQKTLMKIDYPLLMQGSLMADVNEGTSLQKAAQLRLDNLGQVKAHSQFINDPERLDRLEQKYEMAKSIGMLEEEGKRAAAEKRDAELAKLIDLLPDALRMFAAGNIGRSFTKAHIRSILIFVFKSSPAKSAEGLLKEKLLVELNTEKVSKPQLLSDATSKYVSQEGASQMPSLPPVPAASIPEVETSPQLETASPSTSTPAVQAASPEESVASLSNPTATWLWRLCDDMRTEVRITNITTLDVANIVLKVVGTMKLKRDQEHAISHYTRMFQNAFRPRFVDNKDVPDSFISELVGKRMQMIDEDDLTESEMRKLACFHWGGNMEQV